MHAEGLRDAAAIIYLSYIMTRLDAHGLFKEVSFCPAIARIIISLKYAPAARL